MFSRYLSAHHVLVPHLHIAVFVEFTENSYDGFEQTQTAIVTLQLAANSAVVPTGGFTVLLSSAPGSATDLRECVCVCVGGCACACACECAYVCVCACMHVCVLACMCVSVCGHLHAWKSVNETCTEVHSH